MIYRIHRDGKTVGYARGESRIDALSQFEDGTRLDCTSITEKEYKQDWIDAYHQMALFDKPLIGDLVSEGLRNKDC